MKLGAWPGFELPDLDERRRRRRRPSRVPTQRRSTPTYYDTADLRLVRCGHHACATAPATATGVDAEAARATTVDGRRLRPPASSTFAGDGRGRCPAEVAPLVAAWVRTLDAAGRSPGSQTARRGRRSCVDGDGEAAAPRSSTTRCRCSTAGASRPASARSRSRSPPTAPDEPARRLVGPAAGRRRRARPTRRPSWCGPSARGRSSPPELVAGRARRRPDRRPTCCGPAITVVGAAHPRARPRRARSTTTPRASTRPGSAPGGFGPTCARSARCSTRRGPSRCATSCGGSAGALGAVRDADVLLERLRRSVDDARRDDDRAGRRARSSTARARAGASASPALVSRARRPTLRRAPRPAGRRRARTRGSLPEADAPAAEVAAARWPARRGRSCAKAVERARRRPGRRGAARGPHPGQAGPLRCRRGRARWSASRRRDFAEAARRPAGRARRPPGRRGRRGVAARARRHGARRRTALVAGQLIASERARGRPAAGTTWPEAWDGGRRASCGRG